MWISQTYLGTPDPDAKVFIYYFWEDYKQQKDIKENIIDKLAELGRSFGSEVSSFAPLKGSHHEIRREIRSQGYDSFWYEIGKNTPGLFLIDVPLGEFNPQMNEYLFFHLGNEVANNEKNLVEIFKTIHHECHKLISKNDESESNLWSSLYDSAQLKITFLGFGIDFKPIISRFRTRK